MAKIGAKDSKEKKWKDKEKKKKKKRGQQTNDYNKKVENLHPQYPHLPYQVCNARLLRYTGSTVRLGSIPKIWRAARACSSAPQSLSLVLPNLPHHEINTTRHRFINVSKTNFSFDLEFDDSKLGFTVSGWACHMGYKWIREDCNLLGPNCSSSDEQFKFTNAIGFGGKFYALSLQGTLAVIDLEVDLGGPPAPRITATMSIPASIRKAIPTTCSKGFREYLVGLDEELLLILLVSKRSMNVIDDVEVFRLDLNIKKGWVQIQNLGDRTMFLGRKDCISFSATQLFHFEYLKKNCIYFNLETSAGWWVFDVGTRSLSLAQYRLCSSCKHLSGIGRDQYDTGPERYHFIESIWDPIPISNINANVSIL